MTETVLQINKDPKELPRAEQEMLKLPFAQNCDQETLDEIYTILEELLLNIINYGFKEAPKSIEDISVIFREDGNTLTIIFRDNGAPFNPLTKLRDENERDEFNLEMNIGGWGINMVRDFSEQLDYKREGEFNIFTVTKKIN
ncbi:MAG: ATP-binding protein [Ignavibacteriaceae bacterium]|nr:ATP-binding protein [Ignavibacteriaceae bacterium]